MKKAHAQIGIAVVALVALALGLFAFQNGKGSERASATSSNNHGKLVQFYSPSLGPSSLSDLTNKNSWQDRNGLPM